MRPFIEIRVRRVIGPKPWPRLFLGLSVRDLTDLSQVVMLAERFLTKWGLGQLDIGATRSILDEALENHPAVVLNGCMRIDPITTPLLHRSLLEFFTGSDCHVRSSRTISVGSDAALAVFRLAEMELSAVLVPAVKPEPERAEMPYAASPNRLGSSPAKARTPDRSSKAISNGRATKIPKLPTADARSEMAPTETANLNDGAYPEQPAATAEAARVDQKPKIKLPAPLTGFD